MHLWKLNIWQLSGLRKNRACLLFVTTWGGSQEAPQAQECGGMSAHPASGTFLHPRERPPRAGGQRRLIPALPAGVLTPVLTR